MWRVRKGKQKQQELQGQKMTEQNEIDEITAKEKTDATKDVLS